MKKIQATTKIFAVTAVFTLALCFAIVKAYDAPYAVGLGMEGIKYAQFKHTDYYTKNVLGDQSVNMMKGVNFFPGQFNIILWYTIVIE